MSLTELLWECFRHFVHLDESNAAVHCSPVRYSPITFRLAEVLDATEVPPDLSVVNGQLLDAVMTHRGAYPEDMGRIEMDAT